LGAPQNFVEAVVGLGHQQRRAHPVGQTPKVPPRVQRPAQGAKPVDEILHIHIQIRGLNFHAGKKFAAELVGKLVELD
jgi:hypothetical protein